MTPQEKALELLNKFKHDFYRYYVASHDEVPFAKIGALIAVDKILEIFNDTNGSDYRLKYWNEVKQEINKL